MPCSSVVARPAELDPHAADSAPALAHLDRLMDRLERLERLADELDRDMATVSVAAQQTRAGLGRLQLAA